MTLNSFYRLMLFAKANEMMQQPIERVIKAYLDALPCVVNLSGEDGKMYSAFIIGE